MGTWIMGTDFSDHGDGVFDSSDHGDADHGDGVFDSLFVFNLWIIPNPRIMPFACLTPFLL